MGEFIRNGGRTGLEAGGGLSSLLSNSGCLVVNKSDLRSCLLCGPFLTPLTRCREMGVLTLFFFCVCVWGGDLFLIVFLDFLPDVAISEF